MKKRRKPPLKFDPSEIDEPDGAANPGGYESNNPQARGPGFASIDAHTPDLAAEHINIIANMLTDDPDTMNENLSSMSPKLRKQLSQLVVADQKLRNIYKRDYLDTYGYPESAQRWIADGRGKEGDIFGDAERAHIAKKLIRGNIQIILQDEKMLSDAWLLTQHMDFDVPFQRWLLAKLPHKTQEYQYLSDRVAVNSGRPQRYKTQSEN